jgi:hypothetical protein
MTALRVFERKTVRIYGPIKEEEKLRIRTSNKVQNILQGASIVKFINSF